MGRSLPFLEEKATEVTKTLLKKILPQFRLPHHLQSDNGLLFVAKVKQQLSQVHNSSIHPGDLSPQEMWNRLIICQNFIRQTLSGVIRVVVSPAVDSPVKGHMWVFQSCSTLCNPWTLAFSDSSVHANSQVRILEPGSQFLLQGVFQILGSGRSSYNVRYTQVAPGLGRCISHSVRISVMFMPNWWLSLFYQDYFLEISFITKVMKPSICHTLKFSFPILIPFQFW